MIRINLIKNNIPLKKNKRFQFKTAYTIIPMAILVVVLAIVYVLKIVITPKKTTIKTIVVDNYSPSSVKFRNVVEDIVSDEGSTKGEKLTQKGMLNLDYKDLSPIEKINYENHFTKRVLEMLAETVLPGVDFQTIVISEYSKFKGNGLSRSGVLVASLFKALRRKGAIIEPKPVSRIYKSAGTYKFNISFKINYHLDYASPFTLGANDLPNYEDLDNVLSLFSETAVRSRVKITDKPKRVSAEVTKGVRVFTYKASLYSSYANITAFVNSLYKEEVPCSFKKFSIKAVSDNSVMCDIMLKIVTKR